MSGRISKDKASGSRRGTPARNRKEVKDAPSSAGFLLAKAHQLSGRVFARLLREDDSTLINPAQGRILYALWQTGPSTFAALARETSLGASTLTAMIDRLEAAGLVSRRESSEDRRAYIVACTEAGAALERRHASLSLRMTELFYGKMGAAEQSDFERSLGTIIANLEEAEGHKTN